MSDLLKELQDITEMTQRAGDLAQQLKAFFDKYKSEFKKDQSKFKHDGDLEKHQLDQEVFHRDAQDRNREIYLVKQDEDLIAYFGVQDDGHRPYLVEAYVLPDQRKTGVFTKFVWYLKNNLKRSAVEMGNVHSSDTVQMLKALYKSKRFKMYWENADTGEKIEYDPETIEKFYKLENSSGWSVILENDHDFKIFRYMSDLSQAGAPWQFDYSWLIEDMTPYLDKDTR